MYVRPASALLCVRLSIVKQWRAWPPCRETGKNPVGKPVKIMCPPRLST